MIRSSGPTSEKTTAKSSRIWNALSYIPYVIGWNLLTRKQSEALIPCQSFIEQWEQQRALFHQRFNNLKHNSTVDPTINKRFVRHCTARIAHGGYLLSLLDVLLRSPDQDEAFVFIMDIIRAKVRDFQYMKMDCERLILVFIRITIERCHNGKLAQQLLLEFPNTDINRAHLRDNTLLMHFIEREQISEVEILLNLKNSNGQICVDPNGPITPLKRAKEKSQPGMVALLQRYGAKDDDSDNEQKRPFEESRPQSVVQGATALTPWEGPADCIDDDFEGKEGEKSQKEGQEESQEEDQEESVGLLPKRKVKTP